MTGKIYLIQSDNQLLALEEQPYANEDMLQTLLEQYPDLLAGDQIDPATPRRWLLVAREMGVPGEAGGGNLFALDHLFLNQDGIPTLVEVKRSSDTRIRREVVGQMLDYAANAVAYWPVESLRARFEATCHTAGDDPSPRLAEFLETQSEDEQAIERFWGQVKTNLQARKLRLIFVADQIPPELRRIVEFLNEQMDPAEVLAVEVRQYVGSGLRTLTPRVTLARPARRSRKRATPPSPNASGMSLPSLPRSTIVDPRLCAWRGPFSLGPTPMLALSGGAREVRPAALSPPSSTMAPSTHSLLSGLQVQLRSTFSGTRTSRRLMSSPNAGRYSSNSTSSLMSSWTNPP